MTVQHPEAIDRLLAAGLTQEAAQLRLYRDMNNTVAGWDGWVQKIGRFDRVVIDTIWPPGRTP